MSERLMSRWPAFDFQNVRADWASQPEVSMTWNAMSAITPDVEVWLNKIMMMAKKQVSPTDAGTRQEIDDFVRQESNHHKMHARFNDCLAEAGYRMTPEREAQLKAELRDMMRDRSLAFNAAYCAGFECFTLFTSKFVFEKAQDLFRGGDLGGSDLWLWHMAEEFEHRAVCHDVFAAISGNYFIRIQGLFHAFFHLKKFIDAVSTGFLGQYRAGLSPKERKASLKRERAYKRRYSRYVFPRMLAILVPYYNPAKAKTPPPIARALERYSMLAA